ncbi:MAG TPA: GAF domain-containing sensor histidine kinase [Polyangia bacterium]|jgi:signal transduction histidine kinase
MQLSAAAAQPTPLTQADSERLLAVVSELSFMRDRQGVMDVVRRAARDLTQADGVTFVVREGDQVFYAEENAIGPLWKGRRFDTDCCISGWAIKHREVVAIEDIFLDSRIPHDVYRATFVKSLAMVPIRIDDPVGAIGAYWGSRHLATARELELLRALAGTTAVALENAELYRQAQDAVRARDDFLGLASHELKTPLTPLKLRLQLLRAGLELGQPPVSLDRELARIESYVDRLHRLIGNLLDVSRVTRGTLSLDPEELDLGAVVREVTERYAVELAESGCTLDLALPGPIIGRWDRGRLEQVVSNLLGNAIKFGRGKPIEVIVSDDDGARLTVRDHGIGISPEDQAQLFGRFERAMSTQHYGGFGVGLWLVRQIVEAHGGNIQVLSAPGEGSSFEVMLPRR